MWLDDLANYEVARHIQIESELETVLSDRNTTQAAALEAELASPEEAGEPQVPPGEATAHPRAAGSSEAAPQDDSDDPNPWGVLR